MGKIIIVSFCSAIMYLVLTLAGFGPEMRTQTEGALLKKESKYIGCSLDKSFRCTNKVTVKDEDMIPIIDLGYDDLEGPLERKHFSEFINEAVRKYDNKKAHRH